MGPLRPPAPPGAPAPLPRLGAGPVPVPGRPDRLFPGLVRLTAPNPGMMTGPGTNTYIVGRDELAVVDPGPDDGGHRQAVVAEAARWGTIRWVLVTHTHLDHAPGAQPLAQQTGAALVGFGADDGFVPDVMAAHGWSLELGPLTLGALHTPGHASNHLCWSLQGLDQGAEHAGGAPGRVVFSGDHIMEGSTVVIRPPDGDMTAYLDSLQAVADLDPPAAVVAPGHGRLITDPAAAVAAVAAHRLQREQVVASALAAAGTATVDQLLVTVYGDVEEARRPVGRLSLWAHLRRLTSLGAVALDLGPNDTGAGAERELEAGRWRWLGGGA